MYLLEYLNNCFTCSLVSTIVETESDILRPFSDKNVINTSCKSVFSPSILWLVAPLLESSHRKIILDFPRDKELDQTVPKIHKVSKVIILNVKKIRNLTIVKKFSEGYVICRFEIMIFKQKLIFRKQSLHTAIHKLRTCETLKLIFIRITQRPLLTTKFARSCPIFWYVLA